MKLIFCGTPEFAVPTLEALIGAGHHVALVVTQPDRPKGRGLEAGASPVRSAGISLGIPIVQPPSIRNNAGFRGALEEIQPDAIIVVGYGRLIPPWMLTLPRHGNLNLHASLLPKYRGAAPIQWAIANGETVTGVTTMRIDEGLDTGGILLQKEIAISPEDTAVTLSPRLAMLGAGLMVETLQRLENGTVTPQPQDDSRASLAPILKRGDGEVDFARPARQIIDRLRGFQPWPGAFTTFRGKKLAFLSARIPPEDVAGMGALSPGTAQGAGGRLFVGCGNAGTVEILKLRLEGKNAMAAADFLRGHRLEPNEKFGA